jgi:hypothetical protein
MGNLGGVAIQPSLGRVADLAGYPMSLLVGGVLTGVALPLLALSRRHGGRADIAVSADQPRSAAVPPSQT